MKAFFKIYESSLRNKILQFYNLYVRYYNFIMFSYSTYTHPLLIIFATNIFLYFIVITHILIRSSLIAALNVKVRWRSSNLSQFPFT